MCSVTFSFSYIFSDSSIHSPPAFSEEKRYKQWTVSLSCPTFAKGPSPLPSVWSPMWCRSCVCRVVTHWLYREQKQTQNPIKLLQVPMLCIWTCHECLTKYLQYLDKVHSYLHEFLLLKYAHRQISLAFVMLFIAVHCTLIETMQRIIHVEVFILFTKVNWATSEDNFACKIQRETVLYLTII